MGVIYKCIEKSKVVFVSGGESGHEPAHAGYVGKV
ncbi:dihydroxyacetone kinase subunit DhaK [Clostridium sp. MT-14]